MNDRMMCEVERARRPVRGIGLIVIVASVLTFAIGTLAIEIDHQAHLRHITEDNAAALGENLDHCVARQHEMARSIAGTGLTGGTITGSGTVSVMSTGTLTYGSIPKWSGNTSLSQTVYTDDGHKSCVYSGGMGQCVWR